MSSDAGLGRLAVLPYTVREEIYKYLLTARHVRICESNTEGERRQMNGECLYAFQLSIMRASRSVSRRISLHADKRRDTCGLRRGHGEDYGYYVVVLPIWSRIQYLCRLMIVELMDSKNE